MHTKPSILTPSRLRPILLAMATGLWGLAAHAGTCNVTTSGAATCAIPAGVASVNVVATGGGGGGGDAIGGAGGAGGIVTATLTGVGGTTLNLYVGGGGPHNGGGGSSNVNAGTASQIIAGGGGGGGGGYASFIGGNGGNGNGGNGSYGSYGGVGGGGGGGGFGGGGGAGAGAGDGDGGGGGSGGFGGGVGSGGGSGGSGGFGGGTYGFGGGGGGGGFGGGAGGIGFDGLDAYSNSSGGGGGGSTGGVVTVASNGGAAGANGGDGSIVITWTDPNTVPSVLGGNTLTVAEDASATSVKGLLHASDTDSGQTLTWTQSAAPSHGTLSITGATASSGGTDITPGGTITYTPTPGYAGSDSFTVAVGDGTGSATKSVSVTVTGATVAVGALTLNAMTVGVAYASQTFAGTGGHGAYTYSVSAGALPAGLTLNPTTGALSGTPTTAGAYGFTIRATDSSTGTGPFSGTRAFAGVVVAQQQADPNGLPPRNLPNVPREAEYSNDVVSKDLATGYAPQVVACLTTALPGIFGAEATYKGQNTTDGRASFSIATSPAQTVSFYPVGASNTTGTAGITLTETNKLTVGSSCGTLGTAPALFNSAEFVALNKSLGQTVHINEDGVITVKSGSTVYVGRPDYVVAAGTPGKPSLTQGSDGLYRFTDSAGNVQVLHPAFLEPDVLRTALGAQFGSFVIQTDGSAVLTTRVNGTTQATVLTPSLTLGTVSADHWADSVWGSGANWTYRVFSFPNATQGYASKAK